MEIDKIILYFSFFIFAFVIIWALLFIKAYEKKR